MHIDWDFLFYLLAATLTGYLYSGFETAAFLLAFLGILNVVDAIFKSSWCFVIGVITTITLFVVSLTNYIGGLA